MAMARDVIRAVQPQIPAVAGMVGGAAVGSLVGGMAQKSLPALKAYPEVLGASTMLAGVFGRKLGGPRAMWDGMVAIGLLQATSSLVGRFMKVQLPGTPITTTIPGLQPTPGQVV